VQRYILTRLLLAVPTLVAVAVLIFMLLRVVPGDIVELKYAGTGTYVPQETIDEERARLGLDQSILGQMGDWLWGIARLDLGTSMWTGRPIAKEIEIRFQLSLQLALMSTVIATLLAVPLGTISALKQDTWLDYAVRIFTIAGLAMPSFWLGILIILVLLNVFGWLPPLFFTPFWQDPWKNLSQLIFPALAVGYRYSAVAARMTRSSVLEVLRDDYIRTARAKGLRERSVLTRHALRNAILPVMTVISLEFAFLLGGLVVTEQVFNLNGLGNLLVESITRRDYTMTQALVLLFAFVYILVNLVIDILYAWLDPRIRYS
jgi:peptide/nickel transport system permease protein